MSKSFEELKRICNKTKDKILSFQEVNPETGLLIAKIHDIKEDIIYIVEYENNMWNVL